MVWSSIQDYTGQHNSGHSVTCVFIAGHAEDAAKSLEYLCEFCALGGKKIYGWCVKDGKPDNFRIYGACCTRFPFEWGQQLGSIPKFGFNQFYSLFNQRRFIRLKYIR